MVKNESFGKVSGFIDKDTEITGDIRITVGPDGVIKTYHQLDASNSKPLREIKPENPIRRILNRIGKER